MGRRLLVCHTPLACRAWPRGCLYRAWLTFIYLGATRSPSRARPLSLHLRMMWKLLMRACKVLFPYQRNLSCPLTTHWAGIIIPVLGEVATPVWAEGGPMSHWNDCWRRTLTPSFSELRWRNTADPYDYKQQGGWAAHLYTKGGQAISHYFPYRYARFINEVILAIPLQSYSPFSSSFCPCYTSPFGGWDRQLRPRSLLRPLRVLCRSRH